MTPSKRRLSSRAADPAPHAGQLASGHVLPRVPITVGGAVPVLVTKERVRAVSQAAGAVARRLAALDTLAHEMDPLAVLGRDA